MLRKVIEQGWPTSEHGQNMIDASFLVIRAVYKFSQTMADPVYTSDLVERGGDETTKRITASSETNPCRERSICPFGRQHRSKIRASTDQRLDFQPG